MSGQLNCLYWMDAKPLEIPLLVLSVWLCLSFVTYLFFNRYRNQIDNKKKVKHNIARNFSLMLTHFQVKTKATNTQMHHFTLSFCSGLQ